MRAFTTRNADDDDFIGIRIDARNAFNLFYRQQMLDAARVHPPYLACFVNMVYAMQAPPLLLGYHRISSEEGARHGDPATMVLFSLFIQPFIRQITGDCDLELNLWYAEDGTIGVTISKVHKALNVLRD